MTPEELHAIEARLNAATPGWRLSKCDLGSYIVVDKDAEETEDGHTWTERWEEGIFTIDYNATDADVAFLVHAPDDVARLVAEVRRLTRELAEAHSTRPLPEPYATPLELLQPETPMEQANVEPARPARLPSRAGWETPAGLVWSFLRIDDALCARAFPLLDGTFGWDIPEPTGETYAQPIAGERGYPTREVAQRAAEEWLAQRGTP